MQLTSSIVSLDAVDSTTAGLIGQLRPIDGCVLVIQYDYVDPGRRASGVRGKKDKKEECKVVRC
jgi:hypothetical protein